VNHEPAHVWLSARRRDGWATCPITENGLIRILSNAAYSGVHEPAAAIRDRLDRFCASGNHLFWADEVSLRDPRVFRWPRSITHRQVTDVYLLGLATSKHGRLATFDRRIPLATVVGARREHLEVIAL
jgi:hypothetical protein